MVFHQPLRARTKPCHVLIIEDNADGRESLRMLLSLLGYDVEVANDGAEGVTKALDDHFDVAIVDLGLPKLNGCQVARQLRLVLGTSIRLLAYTAYDSPETVKEVKEAPKILSNGYELPADSVYKLFLPDAKDSFMKIMMHQLALMIMAKKN